MRQIKFSHYYEKMPFLVEGDKTFLIEVLNATKDELSGFFVDYDTKVRGENTDYGLSEGKLLILLLLTYHHFNGLPTVKTLWTTTRRHTNEKEAYYHALRGQEIEVVMI